ncbi:MAG: DNA-binding protein WhiA [Bacilli bacterium]|nr:DNA-binding protein WhiA [Bacilli bacterium]
MSFSMSVRDEVSKIDGTRTEKLAELSAIIRNSGDFEDGIRITIENNCVARKIFKLFKEVYDINAGITVRRRYGFNNNLIYMLYVNNKCDEILKDLSIIDSLGNYLDCPREFLISDGEDMRAYLRGLFMASGSVNDPKTSRYHLEFVVDNGNYANFINDCLNSYNLNSKVIKREKNYMVYVKEAEKISDFLRLIKSYNGVMYFEDIRIYRDHKNMTNRLNNCEQANIDKIFITASKQISDIEKIKENDLMDVIDDKLKEVIDYRLKYPESSLSELALIMSNELGYHITKSGLNHRFRKIRDIVQRLGENGYV